MSLKKINVSYSCAILLFGFLFVPQQVLGQGNLPSPLEVQRKRQQEAGGQVNSQQAQQQRNLVQTAKFLFTEVKNLVPGGLEEGTDGEKEVRKAIDSFLRREFNEATSTLENFAKTKKGFPPKELLLAGMWYAVSNANQGLANLEKAAVENPDYPGIFNAFARLAIGQNRLSDGLAMLEKSQRLIQSGEFSKTEKDHFQFVYLDAMTDLLMKRKDYSQARTFAVKAQAIDETAKILLSLAELDFHDGNLKASETNLLKLKEKNPEARVPEIILAGWYGGKKDEANLEKYVRLAAEKYPEDPNVQLQFADFCIGKEDFQNAQIALEKVEKGGADKRVTLPRKAKIAFASEAYGLAESHYEQLTRIKQDFNTVNMFALSLAESEDEEKRKKAYAIAAQNYQRFTNNPVAIAALAWVSLKTGRTEQAQQMLQRVAGTPQLAPEIAYYLATMLHKQEKSQQAKLILGPALETKGFFFYRNAAKRLMAQIDAAELPAPKK